MACKEGVTKYCFTKTRCIVSSRTNHFYSLNHHHHNELGSWPVPVTRIKIIPSTFRLMSLVPSALRFILTQQLQDSLLM
jgi:hypothetical protein